MLVAAGWTGGRGLRVFCGGEALDRDTARALLTRAGEVWNLYGPTETTIWSSVSRIGDGEPITLGHPIANTVFHLLDGAGRPVPTGVPAELYIGGDGLAGGYLGQPELTAQRFVPNPVDPEVSPLLYRTGDLVRRTAGGALEYLGRIDAQVKIRGFRVELGEIEQAARELPGVADAAVVLARTGSSAAVLRCFYTPTPGGPRPDRADLGRQLPEYMIPDELIELPALPKTLNDKIDRQKVGHPGSPGAPASGPRSAGSAATGATREDVGRRAPGPRERSERRNRRRRRPGARSACAGGGQHRG